MLLRHLAPSILLAILIIILSGLPGNKIPSSDAFPGLDKLIHGFLYCLLVISLIVGLMKQSVFKRFRHYAIPYSLIFGVSYGILIELLQGLIFISRSIEFGDVLANTIGSFSAVAFFYIIYGDARP